MNLTDRVLDRVIELAKRTPYFHLYHGDGTLYMERYWIVPLPKNAERDAKEGRYTATWRQPVHWLLQKLGIAIRLHCIHTADLDRAMHDHPWTFMSVVLRGWYVELRPAQPEIADFSEDNADCEPVVEVYRRKGEYAVRRFTDRHRILTVSPGGVWTLFITFRKRQSWGFFTPQGKIWWWVFESAHNTKPISGKPEDNGV